MHGTLGDGIFVEVLSADAWKEGAASLRTLMESDNLDQATCMADHEIHQLEKIHQAIQAASPGPGEALWPSVWRQLEASAGAFAEDDCIHRYYFSRSPSARSTWPR